MWCKHCRQDVPGMNATNQLGLSCARCGAALAAEDDPQATHAVDLTNPSLSHFDLARTQPPVSALPSFEEWDIDQSFQNLQARVGSWKRIDPPAETSGPVASPAPQWRVDGGHGSVAGPHPAKSRASRRSSLLAWSVLSLGLITFACGAVLLTLSFAEDRSDLWSWGIPVAVAGQVGLLLGLALQLERLWQNGRYAARKLEQVDSQLHHLEHTTTMLGVTHSSAAQAFYVHMADEANPQMLLADLKGQLDLLADSMSKRIA
jgi:hypothetical protein